ncbi:hypothetical protein D3C73_651070 [compost metagenome]
MSIFLLDRPYILSWFCIALAVLKYCDIVLLVKIGKLGFEVNSVADPVILNLLIQYPVNCSPA